MLIYVETELLIIPEPGLIFLQCIISHWNDESPEFKMSFSFFATSCGSQGLMLTQSFSISQNVPVTLTMFILKIIVTSRKHKLLNLRLELPMSMLLHESEPEMLITSNRVGCAVCWLDQKDVVTWKYTGCVIRWLDWKNVVTWKGTWNVLSNHMLSSTGIWC